MPRYFFHLSFGRRAVPDEEGVELPNRMAARDEALAAVRDLADPKIGGSSRRWASWFLEIADDEGPFFRTPIGHPALELVTVDGLKHQGKAPDVKPERPAAHFPEGVADDHRAGQLVRQMRARRDETARLLTANEQLRRELSSTYLASENIRTRSRHLVSVARAGGTRC
jgi:hypothetical protein